MHLKTIFNRVTKYKPFVVDQVNFVDDPSGGICELTMRARGNGLPTCSGCGQRCPGYERQPSLRRFDFIPLWMISVVLIICQIWAKIAVQNFNLCAVTCGKRT